MRVLLALAVCVPGVAFAAGGGNDTKPSTTNTTSKCKGTQVWDVKTQSCMDSKESQLESDTLYSAVRELAYAGRYTDAQGVLSVMADQNDDRVLTYWGFTHRKLGNAELAQAFYEKALSRNPDNHLARSYMAQGLIAEGKIDLAIAQWRQIKARGGAGTWAEVSLKQAIATGEIYNY
ncbi:MAG: tetratricopeptide repeat protein [Arenibacterium sp.]